jgi:hypothetical protein
MSIERLIEVLIVGASGVFGSRLARLASREHGIRLTLGGRRRAPLDALAAELSDCAVQVVDRDQVSAEEIDKFNLVIDCAGPFQGSQTRLVEQCLAAGIDYVDLADARDFVCSVGRFDDAAKRSGVAIISGASSIPALSHAVLDAMTAGWRQVEVIRIGIFPGNRAPRGRSVVEAILSYVGKPVRVFSNGQWQNRPGWSLHGRMDCGPAGKRWASVCDTPEPELLVRRYQPTRSADFVAGIELPLLHLGLWLLSFLVRWRWIKSLRPWSGALLRIAEAMRPFGSDRGAMVVEASGLDSTGQKIAAEWRLDAAANLGPFVPVVPALALLQRMRDGRKPEPGAYPCSGVLGLDELEGLLHSLGIRTTTIRPAVSPLRAAA